jgi:hypothetical protein
MLRRRVGPEVELLAAELHTVAPQEPPGLAVVGKMVGILVSQDRRHQPRPAHRAGDARLGRGGDHRRQLPPPLALVLLAHLAPPVERGPHRLDLVVVLLADLHEVIRRGLHLGGHDDLLDDHGEVAGEKVVLAPAGPRPCVGVLRLRAALSAGGGRRGRLGLSQHVLAEVELVLVGIDALGLAPEEPVLQRRDDLVLALDLAHGGGEPGLRALHALSKVLDQAFDLRRHDPAILAVRRPLRKLFFNKTKISSAALGFPSPVVHTMA